MFVTRNKKTGGTIFLRPISYKKTSLIFPTLVGLTGNVKKAMPSEFFFFFTDVKD